MNEIIKYRNRIIRNLIIVLVLIIATIITLFAAAQDLKSQHFALLILALLFVEFPIIFNLSFSGIKAINLILDSEEKQMTSTEEMEKLDKEVEEKAKEADTLTFNFKLLQEDMSEYFDIESFGQSLLSGFSKQIDIVTGVFFAFDNNQQSFEPKANYAYYSETPPVAFAEGEGLNGQAVKDKNAMHITELPEGYIKIISGLGSAQPKNLLLLPIINDDKVLGLLEIATFKPFDKGILNRTKEIGEFIGSLIAKIG